MCESRIEPEAIMLDVKRAGVLGDASLAQDTRLLPLRERFADDGAFLECVLQHEVLRKAAECRLSLRESTCFRGAKADILQCSLRSSRNIRSLTATRGFFSS